MSWKLGSKSTYTNDTPSAVRCYGVRLKFTNMLLRIKREQGGRYLSLRYPHTLPLSNASTTRWIREYVSFGDADSSRLLWSVQHRHSDRFQRLIDFILKTGRGLALPPGVKVPDIVQKALDAAPPRRSTSNRESMQRKRNWWLPYVVLEYDKNEVLIDALGGDLSKPEWNYRADL